MPAETSPFDTLLRGSTMVGPPAAETWSAIGVGRRHLDAIERPEEELGCHHIILWGDRPTIAEREYRVGRFQRVVKPAHSLSLGCAGRLPAARALTPYDVTACVIDAKAALALGDEMELKGPATLHDHLGVADEPLAHLIRLVVLESDGGGSSGSLYRESIEQALISRFLRLARTESVQQTSISPLPKYILQRALDRLASEYETDVSLSDLAREAGYSRSHFHRMFHLATGKTPFECLRDIRLEAARRDLLDGKETIASIAARVGFSSHSHLTRFFIRKYGISPSEFRRSNT